MLGVRVCPEGPRPSAADGNMGTQLADCNTAGPAPAIVAAIVSVVDVEVAEVAAAAAVAEPVAAAAQDTMLAAKKPTVCWTWRRHCE